MIEKEKFLRREFQMLSWKGSVGMNPTYKKKGVSENKRKKFKKWLCDYCDKELLPMYESQKVSESVHYQNIEKLKNYAKSSTKKKIKVDGISIYKILLDDEYKIGTAQKFLNLQLKYLWCAGMSKKPPHCPIDRTILEYVGWNGAPWTQWNSIFIYKWAIELITEKSHSEGWDNIADWELCVFNKER